MATKSDICNFALSHIGLSQFVSNIDTDQTKEARVCKKWWDTALDFSLRDFDWNFSRRYIDLALLATTVPSHWTYKYTYPPNCLMVRAVMPPGIRLPRIDQRVPYETAGETTGGVDTRVIYTNQVNAVMRFSTRITDVSLFDPEFVLVQSYMLASLIAMPMTVKPQIMTAMREAYLSSSRQAAAVDLNEAEDGPEPDTETAAARNG